jgi:Na+-translocating ferredoxin:NAD+ oxidoreductase RnfA subunit
MPAPFSLPLIAALLLNNIVVAQHIGLRRITTLREACGLGVVTAIALAITVATAWPLQKYLLQPLRIDFLFTFIALIILAITTQITEQLLRATKPQLFPINGNHLPLAITNGIILLLALNYSAPSANVLVALGNAMAFGIGAAVLLLAYQALRERIAHTPDAWRGPAIEMLCAGFIVVALCGLTGLT